MKQTLLALTLCLISLGASAQDPRVAEALSALPVDLGDGARVVYLEESGEHKVLKDGTNGITCRVPMGEGFYMVRCYPDVDEALFDRLDSFLQREGLGPDAARDRILEDIREGAFQSSAQGSTHFLLLGADYASAELLYVIMLPMRQPGDVGTGTATDHERPYIMWEGTELAHLMVHGERE